jgi:hypothetical protein
MAAVELIVMSLPYPTCPFAYRNLDRSIRPKELRSDLRAF